VLHDSNSHSYFVDAEGPSRVPHALVDSTLDFYHPEISPDGRFVAGTMGSVASSSQVFVQSLVGPPGRWQISAAPASRPRWTKGGNELIFEGRDGRMMAVDIESKDGFRVGTPRVLFGVPIASPTFDVRSWSCDASGNRFVLMLPSVGASGGSIEVASGFQAMVSRK